MTAAIQKEDPTSEDTQEKHWVRIEGDVPRTDDSRILRCLELEQEEKQVETHQSVGMECLKTLEGIHGETRRATMNRNDKTIHSGDRQQSIPRDRRCDTLGERDRQR
jgi:hypothetical protein